MNNKVSTSTEKNNNSIYTKIRNWIIAWSLFFTLWSQPAEAKTVEKNSNPIEMTSDNASTITENVEQHSIPNYINQAEAWVKKYYPERNNYFETLFNEFKWGGTLYTKAFNAIIHEWIKKYDTKNEINKEKDFIIITLLTIDNISNTKNFVNNENIKIEFNENNNIKRLLWKICARKFQITLKNIKEKLTYLDNREKEVKIEELEPNDLLTEIEERFMKNFDPFDMNYFDNLKTRIKIYIELENQLWKEPTELAKKWIKEYKKLQ